MNALEARKLALENKPKYIKQQVDDGLYRLKQDDILPAVSRGEFSCFVELTTVDNIRKKIIEELCNQGYKVEKFLDYTYTIIWE